MDDETYDRLLNRYGTQAEILDGYLAQGPPTVAFIEELIVANALAHEDKEPRALAKKVVKKHGSEAAKAVLKCRPRVNYTANKWRDRRTLVDNLAELNVEGFSTAVFSKYVARLTGRSGGLVVFFDKASDEQLTEYFIKDCYSEDRTTIHLNTGRLTPVHPRVVAALFRAALPIADRVSSVSICSHDTVVVPPSATALTNLERFVVEFAAQIEGLETVYELPSLERLEITHCKLAVLPEGIAKLSGLVKLDLSSCESLTELPSDIAGLRALRDLNLFGCGLRSLPDDFGSLTELRSLDVRNNERLTSVPDAVAELPNLLDGPRRLIHDEFFKVAKDPYESVFDSFSTLIRQYEHLPAVAAAEREYLDTRDGPKAHIPELILAMSRCYYDQEHGWSSNKFWAGQIEALGPQLLKAANRAVSVPNYTKSTSKRAHATVRKRLRAVEGFDVSVFYEFVDEMVFNSGNPYIDDEQPAIPPVAFCFPLDLPEALTGIRAETTSPEQLGVYDRFYATYRDADLGAMLKALPEPPLAGDLNDGLELAHMLGELAASDVKLGKDIVADGRIRFSFHTGDKDEVVRWLRDNRYNLVPVETVLSRLAVFNVVDANGEPADGLRLRGRKRPPTVWHQRRPNLIVTRVEQRQIWAGGSFIPLPQAPVVTANSGGSVQLPSVLEPGVHTLVTTPG